MTHNDNCNSPCGALSNAKSVASEYEHADAYPDPIVTQMADMGLFGCILPTEYGGQGIDYISYAIICEELSRGSIGSAGILNSHLMMALMTCWYGTKAQSVPMYRPLPAANITVD